MKTIAILNEKGGTAKTTTSVNLAASLGSMGQKVLLVDLDGQAASSRWLGVEGDTRLADAMLAGTGLVPIENVIPGVSLAPASGKLDSISHNLRPTQGSQLRRVLAEVKDRYDYILIDCPPSLGNRLIGNALLAATHAIVPVETSILALDGLRILLTMLDDIRQGFDHEIELIGALGCRFNSRTRLSRLVLAELHRALPGKVFGTVIHETVRMQECPASGQSILEYAPDCSASVDYQAAAAEVVNGIVPCTVDLGVSDLTESGAVDHNDLKTVVEFRERANTIFQKTPHNIDAEEELGDSETTEPPQSLVITPIPPVPTAEVPAPAPVEPLTPVKDEAPKSQQMPDKPVNTLSFEDNECSSEPQNDTMQIANVPRKRRNTMVATAAAVMLGLLGVAGWVGIKAILPSPESASARPTEIIVPQTATVAPLATTEVETVASTPTKPEPEPEITKPEIIEPEAEIESAQTETGPQFSESTLSDEQSSEEPSQAGRQIVITADDPTSDTKNEEANDSETDSNDAPTPQPTGPRVATAADYPDGLVLTAVMYGQTSRRAIISGAVAIEGETVKGAKIVKIFPDSVEIEANGFRFLLGTGPKPVWLKATQVPDETDEPDETDAETDTDVEASSNIQE
ncbi:MAG: ParA family protein [Phycisphaerales bacterium]|nr:ParA family protein [Phycisphaerales bacterium]